MDSLEAEIASARKSAKKTTTLYEKLQGEVDALQKSILDAGGEGVKKQRVKVDKCVDAVEAAETAVTEAELEM